MINKEPKMHYRWSHNYITNASTFLSVWEKLMAFAQSQDDIFLYAIGKCGEIGIMYNNLFKLTFIWN